jgi:hypothetical protein
MEIPSTCITIAYIYFNRMISTRIRMKGNDFFLSYQMIENIAITCLLLAAKFHCETDDVLVNVDIAMAMKMGKSVSDGKKKLDSMEVTMLTLLDKMFITEKQYNMEQKKLNDKIKQAVNEQN